MGFFAPLLTEITVDTKSVVSHKMFFSVAIIKFSRLTSLIAPHNFYSFWHKTPYMECILLCICPTRWTTLRNMSIAIKATVPVSSQLLSCKNVKVKLCISELAKTQMHIIEAPRLQIEFWPLHHFVAVHQLHLYWWSVTPYK